MINLNVNSKLEPFITRHKPLKIIIGGRGSGKSIAACDVMTHYYMGAHSESILCIREHANSVKESIHREMIESINERTPVAGWTIQKDTLIAPNGARTVYKGANRDPNALKSMTGFEKMLFDEAQTASQDSIDKIVPTVIRADGRECWFVGNPEASGDAFSQRFIVPFQKQLDRDGFYEDELHMIAAY